MNDDNLTRREFVLTTMKGTLSLGALAAVGTAVAKPRAPAGEFRQAALAAGDARAIFRGDMSRCQPAEALSRSPEKNHW